MIHLLLASFLSAFGLGYIKFFALESLATTADKAWVVQVIGAMMTLGPVLVYGLSGRLVPRTPKGRLMATCAAVTTVVTGLLATQPFWIWTGLLLASLAMGIFSSAKMSAVVPTALSAGRTVAGVNGFLSVSFIVGTLVGLWAGTLGHGLWQSNGVWPAVGAFGLCALVSKFWKSDAEAMGTSGDLTLKTLAVIASQPRLLLAGSTLWAMAGCVSLGLRAIVEERGIAGASLSSLLPAFGALGAMVGCGISPALRQHRTHVVPLAIGLQVVLLLVLPLLLDIEGAYAIAATWSLVLGLAFGLGGNLIDAAYLEKANPSLGATVQSAVVALLTAMLSGLCGVAIAWGWIESADLFIAMAMVTLIPLALAMVDLMPLARTRGMSVFFAWTRRLLALRYQVQWEGEKPKAGSGVLVLPNHPALIDPVLVESHLWPTLQPRPVVTESFYDNPLWGPMMKGCGAFRMPDLSRDRGWLNLREVDRSLDGAAKALSMGENVLMYPAGRLSTDGREVLGSNSGVHRLLEACPDAKVYTLRTEGLWGSAFSKARSNGTPDPTLLLPKLLWALVKGCIFFLPRQKVTLTLEHLDARATEGLGELNARIESAIDRERQPRASLIPFEDKVVEHEKAEDVDPRHWAVVKVRLVARDPSLSPTPESRLSDLGLDSLGIAELVTELEEELGSMEKETPQTAGDLCRVNVSDAKQDNGQWYGSRLPTPPQGENLVQAFDAVAKAWSDRVLLRDTRAWKASELKLLTHLVEESLRDEPGRHVGVMLPASAAAGGVILGVLRAGKVPVLLNWTTGRRALAHAMEACSMDRVISSKRFLRRLGGVDLEPCEKSLVFLEDLGESTTLKLRALVASRLGSACDISPEETAVVLFTSGSEAQPKAVPLSHRNLMSNISDVLKVQSIGGDDVMMGFLPPFHAFGLSVTTLLPLICGLRCVFHPNPTESRAIAKTMERSEVSIVPGPPSFLKPIFSLLQGRGPRLAICGAEKADRVVRERAEAAGTVLLEGYGATECSPVICMQRHPDDPGVGASFPSCQILVVDPETKEEMAYGERGLVLVRGENVFSGYAFRDQQPFIEVGGRQWYDTGDLGRMDGDALILEGRSQRFVKVGGEMISLPALETELQKRYVGEGQHPAVVVEAHEVDGVRPRLVAFALQAMEIKALNAVLKEAGFSNLSRLSEVVVLENWPELGSGKLDRKALKRELARRATDEARRAG